MSQKVNTDQMLGEISQAGGEAAIWPEAAVERKADDGAPRPKRSSRLEEQRRRRAETSRELASTLGTKEAAADGSVASKSSAVDAVPPTSDGLDGGARHRGSDEVGAAETPATASPPAIVPEAVEAVNSLPPRDRRQPAGGRAQAYRARADSQKQRAEKYESNTDKIAKDLGARRQRERQMRDRKFELEMLADGAELSEALTEEVRALGFSVVKISELLLEASRAATTFDEVIAWLRSRA
jgi:hypothetical protein